MFIFTFDKKLNTYAFLSKQTNKQMNIMMNVNHKTPNNDYNLTLKKKLNGFIQLIRPKSILPTLLLNFSGGWIMNPNIYSLLQSKTFIIATMNTTLVLMSSMVVNDIYDADIDKTNNPSRPIASGLIKKYEAIVFNLLLIGTAEYFNIHFLPENLKMIINFAILNITLYTPVFKKIPLIKNLSCSSLVAFNIFYSGLSGTSDMNQLIVQNVNYDFLLIEMSLIFFGSLNNEILLDIRDYDGDKENNVKTIPVLFGKDIAWISTLIISNLNILSNSLSLFYITNSMNDAIILALLCSPLSFYLYKLKNKNYSKEVIEKVVNDTNIPLFFTLVYFISKTY
jgi:4-hydroxybenzoate polyprenyltransferase